jgi:hypothetical protein
VAFHSIENRNSCPKELPISLGRNPILQAQVVAAWRR